MTVQDLTNYAEEILTRIAEMDEQDKQADAD